MPPLSPADELLAAILGRLEAIDELLLQNLGHSDQYDHNFVVGGAFGGFTPAVVPLVISSAVKYAEITLSTTGANAGSYSPYEVTLLDGNYTLAQASLLYYDGATGTRGPAFSGAIASSLGPPVRVRTKLGAGGVLTVYFGRANVSTGATGYANIRIRDLDSRRRTPTPVHKLPTVTLVPPGPRPGT